ncbi:hypothetical protein J437_LFUL016664 [Ladona fulva]|uniref:Uracil-DNA glycosylase-like domain-containing protein n=1 Tax=Ladona fulva TaxID=123851 RepID=A0A8K0P6W7_LADFU|nr:hypothetical protein J437_LFUL016664 [Ladona fulva]
MKIFCSSNVQDCLRFCDPVHVSIAEDLLAIEKNLSYTLNSLKFEIPVCYVYNPLEYASILHSMFVRKYCNSTKKVLFLGMNPGPWGMSQTGVPFGEISVVRDWLELDAPVGRPQREHPQRPVTGLACHRSEPSGRRFWGLLRKICPSAISALADAAVYNHCPISLLSESGRNITPAELKSKQLEPLLRPCDSALVSVLKLLQVNIIVSIGKYAEARAKAILRVNEELKQKISVVYLPHPSPRNLAIKDWEKTALEILQNSGIASILVGTV